MNFNSNLLCKVKSNFQKGLLSQRAGPCTCRKPPSISPLISSKPWKSLLLILSAHTDGSPNLSSLLFLLLSAKKLLTDSETHKCTVWLFILFEFQPTSATPALEVLCYAVYLAILLFIPFSLAFLQASPLASQEMTFSSLEQDRFIKFPFSR